ncbi:hypothetical protein GLAREA_00169 [Glarea lozoyensis ATCC 20868]|uniref:Uncharacterized protein n=2 Tax=Glarea lozoyensis TaxID=101852 RepID=S3DAK6_GLAL2|nr:uncharacterized protein GLAREA_00169 [Glarea lozoyensis ATCC 20868]EHL03207.1 hypothetical protein M7I_0720 [Glarea lozoyensis 74030]EPE29011.1 hypothetical protein GLAREA_00169 [Glarea lozoyensis ATCC 20868]
MSSKEGRQSPAPEESTGAQQQDTPGDGQGVNPNTNNKEESKSQLDDLSSNPKPVLQDHIKETVSKTTDPSQSSK